MPAQFQFSTRVLSLIGVALLVGCGAASPLRRPPAAPIEAGKGVSSRSTPLAEASPKAGLSALVRAHADQGTATLELPSPEEPIEGAPAAEPLKLDLDASKLDLPAGRSIIEVALIPDRFISIGVLGKTTALLCFDIISPPLMRAMAAHSALDEDGILPRMTSFRSPAGVSSVTVVVDVTEPVELVRAGSPLPVHPPPLLAEGPKGKRPLLPLLAMVGLPTPVSRDDGYLLQSPSRYQFLRLDVAGALLAALRQTRARFRRDPIAIADISQWDGRRPATDLGKPRHISHEGGRDVDIALPASDGEPSTVRAHCEGVLIEADVQGCAPGTARGFDALRTAYFLGLLLDSSPVGRIERVFTDDAYVREIRRAAGALRERRWIKDEGFEGLFSDNLVRASPWHTDHIHIRFTGAPGQPIW